MADDDAGRRHPNVERARRGFEAFAAGDISALEDLIADEVVWHEPGHNMLSGTYRGRGEVLKLLGRMWDETHGTLRNDAYDIVGDDHHVVVLTRATAERRGKRLDQRVVQVFHVEEARLAERWLLTEDLAAIDSFWS